MKTSHNMSLFPDHFFIFIVAGGSGKRFWPISRKATPKHLIRLLGNKTLLEQTIERFDGIISKERIFVITNIENYHDTLLSAHAIPHENVIAEPIQKNTGPAALLATAIAQKKSPHAVVGFFPSDHMINDIDLFQEQVREAFEVAEKEDAITLFSISPTSPSTAFGYILFGERLDLSIHSHCFRVKKFIEKPNTDYAQKLFLEKKRGWNGGMFFWKADVFNEECHLQQPLFKNFLNDFPKNFVDMKPYLEYRFPLLSDIALDIALIENAKKIIALVAKYGWSDLGSWTSLPDYMGCNQDENTIFGPAIQYHSCNNIVMSKNQRLIALCDVQDMIVVDTQDVILICHRRAAQDIKKLPIPEKFQ